MPAFLIEIRNGKEKKKKRKQKSLKNDPARLANKPERGTSNLDYQHSASQEIEFDRQQVKVFSCSTITFNSE